MYGDSSSTRLLIHVSWNNICVCCELASVLFGPAEDLLTVGAIDWNTLRILRSLRKSSTQLEPNGYGAVSDRCLRTSNSAGYGDVECRRWFQAFQPRWSKRVRSEAMENVVSVEDDCYDICWMEMR